MKRLLPVLLFAALVTALNTPFSFAAGTSGKGPREELAQQPDPKKREITTSISRSAEDESIILQASFPEDAPRLRVALYNMIGRLIQVHPITAVEKGDYPFRFLTSGLPTGPYIVVLEANGQRIVNKVMLSR